MKASRTITLVASRWAGSAPIPASRARMPPDTVAMPPTMTASSSDVVIGGTYGLMMSGASVWPMNTFADADSVSAPLVRMK